MTCDLCDSLVERLAKAIDDRLKAEERLAQVVRGRRALERRVTRLQHQLEAQQRKQAPRA